MKDAYHDRLARLQDYLAQSGNHAAFIPSSSDLQYVTGIPRDIPNFGATLHPLDWLEGVWIKPDAPPLMILSRMSAQFGGVQADENLDVWRMGDHDDPVALVKRLVGWLNLPNEATLAVSDFTRGETISRLRAYMPDKHLRFTSATDLLRTQRVTKTDAEIAFMRRAGEITEAAFADVLANLRHGMMELDVVSEVDYQLRRHGSLGPSFTTSLYVSGPEHPLTFGRRRETWPRVLTPPVSILFDFGAIYEGYCYDFGRTVFFGEPDEEAQHVHELVMRSQAAGIAALKPGTTAAQVDKAARDVIDIAGYGEAFRHRLGHGIGMDVHEPPFLTAGDDTALQTDMLFTVEPSITQFHTFSARVEDVVAVAPNGGEALTDSYPSLIVID